VHLTPLACAQSPSFLGMLAFPLELSILHLAGAHHLDCPQVPPEDVGGPCDLHAPQLRQRQEDAHHILVRASTQLGPGILMGMHACACVRVPLKLRL